MSYKYSPKKHPELAQISKNTVTRRNMNKWDQRAKPSAPQIILGI